MTVYAVFQQGVYRHACAGVFTTVDAAIEAALHFISNAGDQYHEYEVVEFVLNERSGRIGPIPPSKRTDGDPIERTPLVRIIAATDLKTYSQNVRAVDYVTILRRGIDFAIEEKT